MRKVLCFLVVVLAVSACKEPEARRPKGKNTTNFYEETIAQNKRLNAIENRKIQQWLANDTIHTYQTSSKGYWYRYEKKHTQDTVVPKKDDIVTLHYEITDLNDTVIYAKETLGVKTYTVDKEDFIPAIQDGIKFMKRGETVVFIIPSYSAFGIAGDGNKIGINQTIKSTVTLLTIKSNN